MDSQVEIVSDKSSIPTNYSPAVSKSAVKFKDVFDIANFEETIPYAETFSSKPGNSTLNQELEQVSALQFIGTTSTAKPTVSHVILNEDGLSKDGWNIIFSDANRDKAYTEIPLGSSIYYNPENGELSWTQPSQSKEILTVSSNQNSPLPSAEESIAETSSHRVSTQTAPKSEQIISLGKVDSNFSTVSHLLEASPELSAEKWNILAEVTNKDKNFRTIPKNTEIWFDPLTRDLSWQGVSQEATSIISQSKSSTPPTSINVKEISEVFINSSANNINWRNSEKESMSIPSLTVDGVPLDLNEAVKPFIGKSYDEIDCYGLVVNGLKEMGVQYSGKDGLKSKLTSMAKEKGLPSNAYLTGEGIVEATGIQVFTHASETISNWTEEAGEIFQKMKQLLQKGQILSFSTPTRGHTGIISQHNDQWTFINSGRMDNHVAEATRPQEVGEEVLQSELNNWFKLAKRNKESLHVTLGQIEENKIRDTLQPNFQFTLRI